MFLQHLLPMHLCRSRSQGPSLVDGLRQATKDLCEHAGPSSKVRVATAVSLLPPTKVVSFHCHPLLLFDNLVNRFKVYILF